MSEASFPHAATSPRERLADVARYRPLVATFLHRDLRTRYLGSRFGWVWSLVNPLSLLVTYSVVFGVLLGADRGMDPSATGLRIFAVYLFIGLVCWNVFASVLQRTIDALLELVPLRRKVSFPILAPIVGMVSAVLVERGVEITLLTVVLAILGNVGWSLLAVPVVVVLVAAFAFGVGLLLAVVNVKFRDVGHLTVVFLQLYFYATPVIYPAGFAEQHLPESSLIRTLFLNNPTTVMVESLRDLMWDLTLPSSARMAMILAWSSLTLTLGWLFFRGRAARIGEES
ncbi:MAG: ABC transporter permease [Candidatus Phosphoribacter sp.]|nr:ABC transporter permease [Actinomycetales bacterium]